MNQGIFTILNNEKINNNTFKMSLEGDTSDISRPGQFINIKIDGFYLRRPISVCDLEGSIVTIIYRTVGEGTYALSQLKRGENLDILTGLGNGYNTSLSPNNPILFGGGVGLPPLYYLAKKLKEENKNPIVIAGFNTKEEIFLENEFNEIGVKTIITTVDGSYGIKGFVTDAIEGIDYSYFFACGPEPMLKAVYNYTSTSGQLSFEERMGCGFGACMGCSCKTKYGNKRICKDGPILQKEEIIW